jgi:hypothetical protein
MKRAADALFAPLHWRRQPSSARRRSLGTLCTVGRCISRQLAESVVRAATCRKANGMVCSSIGHTLEGK